MTDPPDNAFLAKSRRRYVKRERDLVDREAWHPLSAHSADVAAVMQRLLREDSVILQRLEKLARIGMEPHLSAFLVYLGGIHDFGKTNHSFQATLRASLQAIRQSSDGHVSIIFKTLAGEVAKGLPSHSLTSLLIEEFSRRVVAGLDFEPLLEATIAHHGRPYTFSSDDLAGGSLTSKRIADLWMPASNSSRVPLPEVRRIFDLAARWSGMDQLGLIAQLPTDPAFGHLFAGTLTLADWIGSTEEAFPFQPRADTDLESYWQEAVDRADFACRQIGVVPSKRVASFANGEHYAGLFPSVFASVDAPKPTALQRYVEEMDLPEPGDRVLIESATGSGKTEAALALYARLRGAGRIGSLVFALPTRATSKAMYRRIVDMVRNLYPEGVPSLALAVGGAGPEAASSDRVLSAYPSLYDDPDGTADHLTHWSTDHSKKFFAAEIVVGTIDQVIMAALAVKHAHLRLAALSRALLVVDEVHSHDRYMLEALNALLRLHSEAGGVSVLMSATLASSALRMLGPTSARSFEEALERPFPTVSTLPLHGAWTDAPVSSEGVVQRASWRLSAEADALAEALSAARQGARVCILRNTVRDAQSTVQSLAEAGSLVWKPETSPVPTAYHSRFTPPDRAALDAAVNARFGKNGPEVSAILVATQVVEQSLDIDFDLMITDLAPVEVLIQRLGRVHRHRERDGSRPPAYSARRLIVIAPDQPFTPRQGDYHGPHGWGSVYENLPALELTRRLILERPEIELPLHSRELLEAVYHAERLSQLEGEQGWEAAVIGHTGRELAKVMHASDYLIWFNKTYGENTRRFDNEERIRTRIGDDSVDVVLDPPAPCWFVQGMPVSIVSLSTRILRQLGLNGPYIDLKLTGRIEEDGVATYLGGAGVLLRYEHTGWRIVKPTEES